MGLYTFLYGNPLSVFYTYTADTHRPGSPVTLYSAYSAYSAYSHTAIHAIHHTAPYSLPLVVVSAGPASTAHTPSVSTSVCILSIPRRTSQVHTDHLRAESV